MTKRVWFAAWVGLGVAIGCGVQSVDYPTDPAATGADSGGTTTALCDGSPCQIVNTGGACTSSSQCAAGKACVNGVCGNCQTNAQCAAGQVCAAGACGQCTTSTQCDPGLQCIGGACTTGSGGDSGATIDGSTCTGNYPGFTDAVGPVWANFAGAGGGVGKQAGDNQCAALYAGSHSCTWEEIKALDTCGKLTALKASAPAVTAWMHRTAAETAPTAMTDPPGGVPAAPARGARCKDWTYPTNHAYDGEWIEFGAGLMTGHFDNDSADEGDLPSGSSIHTVTSLQCAGETRRVLCCN